MAGEIYYPNVTGTFNWGTLLDGLMKVESYRLQRLELQKQTIDQKIKALQDLKTKLDNLYNYTSGINESDWFNKKKIENNNPDIVDASIINNNIPEYVAQGKVNKVAEIEISYFSRTFKDANEQFDPNNPNKTYNLTLKYNLVNGQTIEKTFTFKGSDTVQSLIDQINNDPDIGKYLHAYLMYTGNGYHFAIMEKDVAASADESTEGTYNSGDLENVLGDYVIMQGAKNSEIQVGNQTFDDPSYEFTDVFPGLKIRVKQTGNFSIAIKKDYDGIAKVFMDLVNKVNDVIRTINKLTKITKTDNGVEGPEISDYSLKELKIRLQNLFQPLLSDPNIAKYNVVNFNDDGTVTVNETALKNFLEENPQTNWGVLYQVVQDAKNLSNLAINDSYVAPLLKSYQNMERSLEERINNYEEYLQEKEQFLKERFASVESYIAQLQQVQAKINSVLTAQMLL